MTRPRTECTCEKCQSSCKHVPGWFLPGEIADAAAALSMSAIDFFQQFLTVDYWAADEPTFVLRPRTLDELGGEESKLDLRGQCIGQCIFYVDGRCQIHAAKPHECATSDCKTLPPAGWHKDTSRAWLGDEQRIITDLLGRKPQISEPDLVDTFNFIWWGLTRG